MVLDECQPPEDDDLANGTAGVRVEAATARSRRWAERCRKAHTRRDQALFGIVQGGASGALRRESARATAELDFDGYAHGGLGLGEARERRAELVAAAHEELPSDAPRYLMGLGRPLDLLDGVAAGVDLFDCVIPTRNGRHGVLFTDQGQVRIKNARFRDDPAPIEPGCDCPACRNHSRAYVCHLVRTGEALGARLASLHNLRFYLRLLERARAAIVGGTLQSLRSELERSLDAPVG
jgi:queuine tRNA-ribosyltransferase